MHGGGGGFNGGGSFHSGGGSFAGGAQHFSSGGNLHNGVWGGGGHRDARYGDYYGYYGGGPYNSCASPYALTNPSYCQYPYAY
jgi:hypothetical protein